MINKNLLAVITSTAFFLPVLSTTVFAQDDSNSIMNPAEIRDSDHTLKSTTGTVYDNPINISVESTEGKTFQGIVELNYQNNGLNQIDSGETSSENDVILFESKKEDYNYYDKSDSLSLDDNNLIEINSTKDEENEINTTIPQSFDKLSTERSTLETFEDQSTELELQHEASFLSLDRAYSNPFKDVKESDWFYNIVLEANAKNLLTGLNSNTFAPYQNMTRGMMATVLYRMAGAPNSDYLYNYFDDVKDGIWYTKGINWTFNNKIMSGYDYHRFGPDDLITREQMAVVLRNFLLKMGYQQPNTNLISKYSDSKSISPYARSAVEFCLANGLMSGTADGKRINPINNATRAECAKMIVLANKKLESLSSSNARIKISFDLFDSSQYCYLPKGTRFYTSTGLYVAPGNTQYILNTNNEILTLTVSSSPTGPIENKKEFEDSLRRFKKYQIYGNYNKYYATVVNDGYDYSGKKDYYEAIIINDMIDHSQVEIRIFLKNGKYPNNEQKLLIGNVLKQILETVHYN